MDGSNKADRSCFDPRTLEGGERGGAAGLGDACIQQQKIGKQDDNIGLAKQSIDRDGDRIELHSIRFGPSPPVVFMYAPLPLPAAAAPRRSARLSVPSGSRIC